MLYRVMYQGQPIGTTRLEYADSGMAVAHGQFDPLPAYELVRPVLLSISEAQGGEPGSSVADLTKLAQAFQVRDALNLTLETEEGKVIPTSWIHIYDWGELELRAPRTIDAQIPDASFFAEQ